MTHGRYGSAGKRWTISSAPRFQARGDIGRLYAEAAILVI
jgi:hypothetical protein